MLLELARPITLLMSILSLLALFHAAFFGLETSFEQRVYQSLTWLALAAAASLLSGLTFRQSSGEPTEEAIRPKRPIRTTRPKRHTSLQNPRPAARYGLKLVTRHGKPLYSPPHARRLSETFPVQVFLWTSSILLSLFLLSWFLENYVMQYRASRF